MKYEERINEFIKLVNADYTINEIAKVLNVTRRSVENYSNKTGLKPKSGKKAPKFNTTFFKKTFIFRSVRNKEIFCRAVKIFFILHTKEYHFMPHFFK